MSSLLQYYGLMTTQNKKPMTAADVTIAVTLFIGLIFVLALVIMALWNLLAATVFPQLPRLKYWHALVLLLLVRLLI